MSINELEQLKLRLKKAAAYFETRFDEDSADGKVWALKEFEELENKISKMWNQILIADRVKNQKLLEEILIDIVCVKKKLGIDSFNFDTAFTQMIAAARWLSLNLSWDNWGNGIESYLNEHEPLRDLLYEVDEAVERAFRLESMWLVKEAIEKYKEAYATVNRIFNSKETKQGFRELLPNEKDIVNPFEAELKKLK